MQRWAKTILLISFAAVVLGAWLSKYVDLYVLDVLTGIGINIILAVSLNLVNGYTGQFSLGHAGFMAVGAYTSAAITLHWGPGMLSGLGMNNGFTTGAVFFLALMAGGL